MISGTWVQQGNNSKKKKLLGVLLIDYSEAKQKKISQNVLVKQILERYIQWDRYSDKIGMVPVPREILESLGAELDGKDIDEIINVVFPMIKNNVMFIKGGYDLERCIETLLWNEL
jgi:hypothetical protein